MHFLTVPLHSSFMFCSRMGALGLLVLAVGCERAERRVEVPEVAQAAAQQLEFVGSSACAGCHRSQHEAWLGSHHQLAMKEPTDEYVLGDFGDASFQNPSTQSRFSRAAADFVIRTEGQDGTLADFSVRYTFGVAPLQQYLLELPGGRLQAHSVAWDSRPPAAGGQRWFHLRPDDVIDHSDLLHWTRDGQNWNYMCADCHSTAVQKNYDAVTNEYATEYAEISVGCEACHGPASAHIVNPLEKPLGLVAQAEQINTCAQCHSRRSQLAEGFNSTRALLDHYLPALLEDGLYHPDGQIHDEVYVYGSFLQSKMHAQGVACSDCHDPHSVGLRFEGNAVCTQCHNEVGRTEFPSLRLASYDTEAHHFHASDSAGSRCVSCHMPARTYMVVDDRRDHRFGVPRPDLTADIGVPNACNGCHDDRSPEWAQGVVTEHHGRERPEHFGPTFAAARTGNPSAEAGLAAIADDASNPAIVRATALALTMRYERGMTTFAIERGLVDPDPLVRIGALRGAERWSPRRRFQKCERLLSDELLAVRYEAARLLAPAYPELQGAEQRRLLTALEAYLQTLQLQADRAEGQTSIANVHLFLGNAERAEQSLLAARNLNAQWVPALVNLADLYRATGRDDEAGPLLVDAVRLAPDAPDVLVARALWLVRQQSPDKALELLKRAYEMGPQNVDHAYVYAVALHSAGQSTPALAVLDETLRIRPRDERLLRTAFGIARDAGLAEQTAEYLRRLESRWSR